MPSLLHLHIVLFLITAFLAAGAIYLYLADGKKSSRPLTVAGIVLLAVAVGNGLAYVCYYGWHYTRMGEHHRAPVHSSMHQRDAAMPADDYEFVTDEREGSDAKPEK